MKVFELTLSPKGQVTFPKEMRDMLNLKAGDQLIYSFIDGQVIITPKNVDFSDLAGLLGPGAEWFGVSGGDRCGGSQGCRSECL